MPITQENLVRYARETAEQLALEDPSLVAAYLTGSLRSDTPFLGNATDIDIVFVHIGEPKTRREVFPLTPDVHLDIVHNPRSLYDKPRELRIHPWLGPELYDPLPLHATGHFFEFVQAGVRGRYHDPVNVQARSHALAEEARRLLRDLRTRSTHGPEQVLGFLRCAYLAGNAIAVLAGNPLSERRFLLQLPARTRAVGQPGLASGLFHLLGADLVDAATLTSYLKEWEKAFGEAGSVPGIDIRINPARLGYYKKAFDVMLASETPQAMLWPLMLTWTLSASVLAPLRNVRWRSACVTLGLDEGSFGERMEGLDHFLDIVDAIRSGSGSQ
jgi:hypothetical protein